MREQVLHVLSIIQNTVSLRYLQIDTHVTTCTAYVIVCPHVLIELVDRLSQWFGANIDQHTEFRFKVLAEASEEVEMRVNLLIVEMLNCGDKVDFKQVIIDIFVASNVLKILPEVFMLYWDCILEAMKQIHYWVMRLLLPTFRTLDCVPVSSAFGIQIVIHFL